MSGALGQAEAVVDEVFSSLPRLKVAAFLAGCDEAEFAIIAQATGTAPSALSKAATHLEEVGYARIRKGHIGRRSRTWLSLTPAGRSAFARHLEALDDLTNRARTTASSEADPAD
ncbi:DNA-binding MarR family transcriptional regulator [Rathayibacter tanaceti]|uniref:Transcriptional regulator n=2 Tax=Rathayibacter tanaceti TaxID=1671680 RepID=A0AAE6RKV5_9MICO|nr:transcriptional regulator [Rathayibacter tanaceti]QHC56500.1 transcriptional regulator [Rathayibacter tanaceti]TCO36708.1 DNA-binding MarR family transcriptional regulator [Rathayibacter tanaceti]